MRKNQEKNVKSCVSSRCADVRVERTTETSRFDGGSWFGGGIIPLGGQKAIYGGFSGVYGEGRKSFIPNRGLLPPYEGLSPKNLRQNFSGEKSGRKKGALLRAPPPKGEIMKGLEQSPFCKGFKASYLVDVISCGLYYLGVWDSVDIFIAYGAGGFYCFSSSLSLKETPYIDGNICF